MRRWYLVEVYIEFLLLGLGFMIQRWVMPSSLGGACFEALIRPIRRAEIPIGARLYDCY